MNKAFTRQIVTGLGTILIFISANAGGLAFDAAGNHFVPDPSRHSVFKYTPDGTKTTFATELKYPLGLCVDGKGNLFVSDGGWTAARSQRSILRFSPDGIKSTFIPGISFVGMAFDRSGNLFVSQGDSIFKFTPKGVKGTFAISKLANFIDLAFDEAGNLFVVDQTPSLPEAGPRSDRPQWGRRESNFLADRQTHFASPIVARLQLWNR